MLRLATDSFFHLLISLFMAALVYDTLTRWYDQCRDYAYFWQYYRGLPGFLHLLFKVGLYTLAFVLLLLTTLLQAPYHVRAWTVRLSMRRMVRRSRQMLKHDLDTLVDTVERERRRRKR